TRNGSYTRNVTAHMTSNLSIQKLMKLLNEIVSNHTFKTILIFLCATSLISCKHTDKNESFETNNDTIYKYFEEQNSVIKQKKWPLNDSTSYVMYFNDKGRLKSE